MVSLNSMDVKYHSPTLQKKSTQINKNFVKKMWEGERMLVFAYQLSETQLTAVSCSHAFL